jgi:hypothetical protein
MFKINKAQIQAAVIAIAIVMVWLANNAQPALAGGRFQ